MNKRDFALRAIQELARENFNSYREDYLTSLTIAIETVKEIAEGYYENRNEIEVERDERLLIDLNDYTRYISLELCSWLNEQEEMKFTNIQELFAWTEKDLADDFGFEDLKHNDLFLADFDLIDEDDKIYFQFKIIEENDFESKVELIEIESI